MDWGTIELEPEVEEWLRQLPTAHFQRAAFYIDLLAEQGPRLREPYSRHLGGGLRELRFHLDGDSYRITYWFAIERRIILLTKFRKTRMCERREVARAQRARLRCVEMDHDAED